MPIIIILLITGLLFIPALWAPAILKKHQKTSNTLPGTGGELAAHLIKKFKLDVTLEVTKDGDHYDPQHKAVRLQQTNMNGRSLTAAATAAHEVGHAIQDACDYPALAWRTRAINTLGSANKAGAAVLLASPILLLVSRSPVITLTVMGLGLLPMIGTAIVHLITLPVEWDASFKRALPILEEGNYINDAELKIARRILTACALTYASQAILGLLSVGRWLRYLRR